MPATLAVAVARRPSTMRRLLRRPAAALALAVVGAFVLIALGAPWLAPFDPIATDFGAVRKAPSTLHRLGTDEVGRDVLARLIWGARASLLAGLIPVTLAVLVSIPLGLVSGYVGGWADDLIMRLTDAMLAVPFLIVAIALAAFLGPSLTNAMIAIGIAALPVFLRLARNTVLAVKAEEYVEAARALGGSPLRIGVRTILPNMLPPLLIQSSLTVAAAIIAESSLSFLARPAAAGAVVGQHAERRAALSVAGAVDGALPRAGDLRDRPGPQRARGRAARRPRSQASLRRVLTERGRP